MGRNDNVEAKNKGFTLTEMMVSMTIFSFLMVGMYTSLAVGSQVWLRNSKKIERHKDMRNQINRLSQDLRQATYFSITEETGLCNENFTCELIGNQLDILKFKTNLNEGWIIYKINTQGYLIRQVIDNNIIIKENIISKNISDFQVKLFVSEDINRNGVIDKGEDINENSLLDGDYISAEIITNLMKIRIAFRG